MPPSADPSVSVTLAEIARIAGVGRAAVSNWRRRHESFPAPVGGTDTSPQFALSQVEEWLQRQGKITEVGSRERLWPEFEALGDRDAMGAAIAATGARLAPAGSGEEPPIAEGLSDAQRSLVERAVVLARKHGAYDTFDFLLGRWLDTHVRQLSITPLPLADLMAEVAELSHDGGTDDIGTVLDPACGTGGLLLAAARRWADPASGHSPDTPLRLLGQDIEPPQAALAAVRLLLAGHSPGQGAEWTVDVQPGNTLRADPHADVRADVVLCNPPFNERDWGYEELATDSRWTYGLPPRTESELAWVQHALARLTPGGTAVLLLPPAVASRKAGRRIRAALLRARVLRAIVALPPGCAPPHSVALHLWVLRAPDKGETDPSSEVLLVDAADTQTETAGGTQRGGRAGIDWPLLRRSVLSAVQAGDGGEDRPCAYASVPVIDLLDDEVDLTPARHVPGPASAGLLGLRRSWTRFGTLLHELRDLTTTLSKLELSVEDRATQSTATVGDLIRAGALTLRSGQQPADGAVAAGDAPADAVPVLTISDMLTGGRPAGWLTAREASAGEAAGTLTVTTPDEVVIVGAYRAFDAWVDVDAPTVLGSQLFAMRVDPALLDPWFLAGCLRAPANARRAGTHASTSSRIDIRRLQVLRLPLPEQRLYGEAFRRLSTFERSLREAGTVGRELVNGLTDGLSAGRLPRGWT
ncbi:N-6 DNA methylase [Streptosporangium canum]|uniref:N-6 DNA methylase n=1 Tax=Streptosporangium canum TaxID=324952 RepID=UPI0033A88A99